MTFFDRIWTSISFERFDAASPALLPKISMEFDSDEGGGGEA